MQSHDQPASASTIQWRFHSAVEPATRRQVTDDFASVLAQGDLISTSLRHIRKDVWVARLDTRRVIIKREEFRTFRGRLKCSVGTPNLVAEFDRTAQLHGGIISVPKPVATGVERSGGLIRRAYSIIEWIENATTFDAMWQRVGTQGSSPELCQLADVLVRLLVTMHTHGIFHDDFHAENILVTGSEAEGYQLHLIDLAPYRPRRTAGRWHRRYAQLFVSLFLAAPGQARFTARTLIRFLKTIQASRDELRDAMAAFYRDRYLPGRDDLHLRPTRFFGVEHIASNRVTYRKEPVAKSLLTGKFLDEVMTRPSAAGDEVFVLRLPDSSAARQLWDHANRLFLRAMPVLKPLLVVEGPDGGAVVFQCPVGLRQPVSEALPARQQFFQRFAALLRSAQWHGLCLDRLEPADVLWQTSTNGLSQFYLLNPRCLRIAPSMPDERSAGVFRKFATSVLGEIDEAEWQSVLRRLTLSRWARSTALKFSAR